MSEHGSFTGCMMGANEPVIWFFVQTSPPDVDELAPQGTAYRVYQLDADDRIRTAFVITAEGDDAAIIRACQMVDGHALELWERSRRVARLEPTV